MKSLYSLVALVAIASPLAAQRTQVYDVAPRGGAIARTPGMAYSYTTSGRAIIGVTVDTRPSDSDTLGATVVSVTPGGPAARAGLLGGDIVTKVNGTVLAIRRGREPEDESSSAGLRMVELLARLSPGDTATIEWKRGTERQRHTARVVTEAAANTMVYSSGGPDFRVYTDEGPGRIQLRSDGARGMLELQGRLEELRGATGLALPGMDGPNVFLRVGGPFGGIQFAPLNADLGRYFGTSEGILVLETPDTSAHVDLKGGDVILAVGDRKPANVEHLFRILGSYEDDETIRFDVMRDKRRVTVEAKAEDIRGAGRMRMIERELMPSRAPGMEVPAPAAPRGDRPGQPRRVPRSGT